MKRRTQLLAMALPLALLLAGCSVNDDQAASNPADSEVAAANIPDDSVASLSEVAELSALVPDKYKQAGVIVGDDGEFLPMRTEYEGKARGFEADLVRGAAAVLGLETTDLQVDFDGLIPGLNSGRIDVISASMADYTERQAQVDFVDFFESSQSLLVAKGNPANITSLDDLCGKNVATLRGSGAANAVDAQSEKCVTDGNDPINVSLFPDTAASMNQLLTGRADAVTNDLPASVYAAQTLNGGDAVDLVDQPLYSGFYYGFGFRQDDTQLRDAWQKAIQHLIDDGWYGDLLTAYGLQDGAIETATVNGGGERPFTS